MAKQQQIKINEVYHYTPSLQNSLNSVISFSKTGVGIAPKKSNNRNKFFFFLIQTESWPKHFEDNKRHRTAHNVQDR